MIFKEIQLSKYAHKFITKTDKATAKRIISALEGLKNKPPLGDIKSYKAPPTFYRLRVGDYRVIFCIENDIIKVTDIDSRGQVYK